MNDNGSRLPSLLAPSLWFPSVIVPGEYMSGGYKVPPQTARQDDNYNTKNFVLP